MSKEKLTITMTIEMHNALYEIADKTGNSMASVVRTAIAKELEEWAAREWRPSIYSWPTPSPWRTPPYTPWATGIGSSVDA